MATINLTCLASLRRLFHTRRETSTCQTETSGIGAWKEASQVI